MTWDEIFGQEYTAVFEDKPPLPDIAIIKPWKVNINNYALYEGDLVKIVGGNGKEWQIEKSPSLGLTHVASISKQLAKTSALVQPPKGHETWTDANFKKIKKVV